MKVYFISGLAADKRVFMHIRLPEGFEIVHLEWIKPLKNETLESYALRLAEKIDTSEKFALLGLSMGGMLATEIAKTYKPRLSILLSSSASRNQFPRRFMVARFLNLHKFIPASFFKSASIAKRLFSKETTEDKIVLKQVIKDSDPEFIRWALGAILQWKNEEPVSPLWHIHGTSDNVLPIQYTKPTHIIQKGGHLMVMSRTAELNEIIGKILKEAI